MTNPFHHPRMTRRSAIQAGGIGILGLGMNHLVPLRAMASPHQRHPTAQSVIYIFLSGGLAQHESFDPKPDAPQEMRGEFDPIATRSPGIHVSEHLPLLAARSDKWALVRSLSHPDNDHRASHLLMLTGRTPLPPGFTRGKPQPTDWPSLASIAGELIEPRTNLPPAVRLPEQMVHRNGEVILGQTAGLMGQHREPWLIEASPDHFQSYGAYPEYEFHHEKGRIDSKLKFQAPSLELPEDFHRGRLQDRVELLKLLDRQRAQLEMAANTRSFDRHREAAISLLTKSSTRKALDVHNSDPKVLDRYGRHSFGWSLLMARQLVEAGVNMVQVYLGNNETWDTHQSAFPNLKNFLLPPMDQSVSALLDDLEERGMLENTLLVMAGEFGRTPRISSLNSSALPGRDHWGAVQTVWLAGGGVKGGVVVGESDRIGGYPKSDMQKPENLAATIYQSLGLPREASWRDSDGRPHFIYHGDPIPGLS